MKQHLTVTVNFPDGREFTDVDLGPVDRDLTWEELITEGCAAAAIALVDPVKGDLAWTSLVLVVVNTPDDD